ncbi:ORF68 [white sturgeon herpesvirus 2]|uniref:ORF68 n=2 Tax=root TaxID=1 RepID=F6GQA2_9VIRU|nr:ORF68 [Acipenserid herpesvirus 2]AEF97722.1 ORF68 [Acipenserid herpesvirus 2]
MSWTKDGSTRTHHPGELSMAVTLEPLVDYMKSTFPIASHNVSNFVNPRLGYVRGNVNLFSVFDSQEWKEAQQRSGVDKSSLIDEDKIWNLSPRSLQNTIKQKKQKMLKTIGPHLDFSYSGLIMCLRAECLFQKLNCNTVHFCPKHFTAHICDLELQGTCSRLKKHLKWGRVKIDGQDGVCVFAKKEHREDFKMSNFAGKLTRGLDQKFKEAVMYDGNIGWTPACPNVALKISKYHMHRKTVIVGFIAPLVAFLNIVTDQSSPQSIFIKKKPVKYTVWKWWTANKHGAQTQDVELLAYEYTEVLLSILYNPELQPFINIFKKMTEDNVKKSVLNGFYLIPLLCIQKLLNKPRDIPRGLLVSHFFYKSSYVTQSAFTSFDKIINKIYDHKLVRALEVVVWGSEIINALEEMSVHRVH